MAINVTASLLWGNATASTDRVAAMLIAPPKGFLARTLRPKRTAPVFFLTL